MSMKNINSNKEEDEYGVDTALFLPNARTLLKSQKSLNKMVKGFVRHVLTPINTENEIVPQPRKSSGEISDSQLFKSSSELISRDRSIPFDFYDDEETIQSNNYQPSNYSYSWLKANYSVVTKNQENYSLSTENNSSLAPPSGNRSRPSSQPPKLVHYEDSVSLTNQNVSSLQQRPQSRQQQLEKQDKLHRGESFHSSASSFFSDNLTQPPNSSQSNRRRDTVYDNLPIVSTAPLANQNESEKVLSPSRKLESRLLAAEVTRLGGIPSSPAQVDINGFLVPRGVMQESVVSLIRKQEHEQSKSGSVGGKIGELAFEESVAGSQSTYNKTSSNIYPALYYKEKNLPEPASVSLIHSNTENSSEKFLKLTSRSKISSIMTKGEDDYAVKWMKMKMKRDHELKSEMKKEKRQELRHLLQRIAINSDKDELQRIESERRDYCQRQKEGKKEEYEKRKQQHEMVLTKRLEKSLKQRKQEAKKLKNSLKESLDISQTNIYEEVRNKIEYFRDHHLANQFQNLHSNISTDSIASGVVDDASSTIVEIPADILFRVKTARSLLQYENAKKELKEFHERTLSQRISERAKRHEAAVIKAHSFGANVSINPIRASTLFSDSLSLDSEDFEDHSSLGRKSRQLKPTQSRDKS